MIWIPTAQRLPSDESIKLVTCETKKGFRSVNRAYYDKSTKFWHGCGSMSGVIAWAEMPKPYDGQSDLEKIEAVTKKVVRAVQTPEGESMLPRTANYNYDSGYSDALVDVLNWIREEFRMRFAADEVEELMRRAKHDK